MSSKRTYFVDSTEVAIGSVSATPALCVTTPSTADCNLVAVRISCEAVSSPAPPSNGSILGTIAVATGTAGGGGSVTPKQLSGNPLAANSVWLSASSAAITGLTKGATLWSHPIPFAAGAGWGETEADGFERPVPVSSMVAVYFTAASGFGSGMAFKVTLDFAE